MVSHTPKLESLRAIIQQRGGLFLRNVQWRPDITCDVCAGIPGLGYSRCLKCNGRTGQPGLVDQLGFVTYAWPDGQAGHTMHAYKEGGETTHQLVVALLWYAVVAHWSCIPTFAGSYPGAWSYVPSLTGRRGQHPLEAIASQVMGSVPHVALEAARSSNSARAFDPGHFTVKQPPPEHVLLLDDTWTSGGHLQSASAALKAAGANQVTGLVIARWLNPSWGDTDRFIKSLPDTFDPAICPYTGLHC